MSVFFSKHSSEIIEFAKQYGIVGLIAFTGMALAVWTIVVLTRSVSKHLIPEGAKYLKASAALADTCTEEIPRIREVVENSTVAVKEATQMAKQCHDTTIAMARESREARDGSVTRDQELKKTVDSIDIKVDEIQRKLRDVV